jgi:hypothetical protein
LTASCAKQIRWLVDPDPCILFLCAGEKNSITELHNPEFVDPFRSTSPCGAVHRVRIDVL